LSINAKDVKTLREKTGAGFMDCKKALNETDGDFEKAIKYLREKGLAEAKKRSGRDAKEGIITVAYSKDNSEVLMLEANCETDFVARTDKYRVFVEELAYIILNSEKDKNENMPKPVKERIKEAISTFGENVVLGKIARFKKFDVDRSKFTSYIHMNGNVGVIIEFLLENIEIGEQAEYKDFAKNVALQIASMSPVSISREDLPEDMVKEQRDIFAKQAKESGKPEKIIDKIVNGRMSKFYGEFCLLEQKYVKDSAINIQEYLKATESKIGGKIEIKRFERFKLGEE